MSSSAISTYTCKLCQAQVPSDKSRCPKCKNWHLPDKNASSDDEETVLLSDAKLAQIERYKTGMLDEVFGGGLARTSVSLVAGPPGAGKTTLFLQLADAIIDITDREAMFIANEQGPEEIKETARRIKIKNMGRIRVVKAMGGLKSDLGGLIMQYKPGLMILDSLTKLTGDDPNLGLLVCERLKSYTVELKAPSLIVNQINKDGDHAGIMKLQHAVDATYFLEKDDSDGERFFCSTKNRFGESPVGVKLLMTPATHPEYPGKLILAPRQDDSEEEEEDDGPINSFGSEDVS
jgi:DNA repair protein RadA/Sms